MTSKSSAYSASREQGGEPTKLAWKRRGVRLHSRLATIEGHAPPIAQSTLKRFRYCQDYRWHVGGSKLLTVFIHWSKGDERERISRRFHEILDVRRERPLTGSEEAELGRLESAMDGWDHALRSTLARLPSEESLDAAAESLRRQAGTAR